MNNEDVNKHVTLVGTNLNSEEADILRKAGYTVDIVPSAPIEQVETPAIDRGEERFKMLFSAINDGFFLADILYGKDGVPCDYRYVEVNPTFLEMTGKSSSEIIGKTATELSSSMSSHWLDVFKTVASTNISTHSEIYIDCLHRDLEIFAFKPVEGKYAALISDISDIKRADNDLHKLNRTLKALSRSAKAMMHAVDESAYLKDVCKIIIEDCGYSMVWIGFAQDDEEKSVKPAAQAGFDQGYLDTLNISWADTTNGQGPTGKAIRLSNPFICKDMLTDPKFAPWRDEAIKRGYASSIALPLISGNQTIGALTIYAKMPDAFTKDEVNLLNELAADLAYGITAIRLRVANAEAEEALRISGQRLNTIINSINHPFFAVDTNWRYIYLNEATSKSIGMKQDDLIGKNIWELWPEMIESQFYENYHKAMNEQKEIEFESYSKFLNKWVDAKVFPSDDGLTVYLSDINEKKKIEDVYMFLLQRGWSTTDEDFFLSLARFLSDILEMDYVCIDRLAGDHLSAETVAIYNDGKFDDNVSYTLRDTPCGDVVGKTVCCFPTEVRNLFPNDEILQEMKAESYIGTTLWSSNGEPIGLIAVIGRKPLQNSHTAETILKLTSIRAAGELERRQAEEKLNEASAIAEEKAAQLESFIASLADGVILFDENGQTIFMNDAGKQIFGVHDNDLSDDWWKYQRFKLDEDKIPIDDTALNQALNGDIIKDFRYKALTPWGKDIIVSVSAAPVRDNQGRIMGATKVFRDISDIVEFERQKEEIYRREHNIAKILQDAIMPSEVPEIMFGCHIAAMYRPALIEAQIGGDFYDIFDLGDGKFGVLIGDVTGKGLPAAMRVAAARYAIRSYAYTDIGPSKVMELSNESLCRDSGDETKILTALFAIIDTRVGSMTYSIAGHEPPVILKNNGECEELSCGGVPFGIIQGTEYPQMSRRLNHGDTIILITDGITEARSPDPILFGNERMRDVIEMNAGAMPNEIVYALIDSATDHAGGNLQDDAAIVAIRYEDDNMS